ncbi:uncharacterized protein LOC131614069 [Vicia villosa]|uniref:uncharacterized protein LOC131614069 n=1 Tax=Vicia villosa TaxID=3911 RepID=UPI00273A818D|nr:uncharacterized protein LOC131614069 [Vicia villosa]
MEGLTALVKKSAATGDFHPFIFGEEENMDILQFADDTIIIGEPSSDNLWSLKVVLRGFELVSMLKINFSKSNVYGVNVGDWFLNSVTHFLGCKRGAVPFSFLGISVGENHSRRRVWSRVINKIKIRLSSWKGKFISIGGRVTLINAVLNAIPTFLLSFYKAPDKGGLGIRYVGEINKALLLKWKWRILTEDNTIWSRFLEVRYVEPKLKVQGYIEEGNKSKDSKWWRDVLANDIKTEFGDDGFTSNIRCTVGKGKKILFWSSLWWGDQTFQALFLDLFNASNNIFATVFDAVSRSAGGAVWSPKVILGLEETVICRLQCSAQNSVAAASYAAGCGSNQQLRGG